MNRRDGYKRTSGLVALLVALGTTLVWTMPLLAQMHVTGPDGALTPASNPLEQQLRSEIGCLCGGCAHEPLTKCTCSRASEMRAQLREQVDQGKDRDQIIDALIGQYGGQYFLTAPLDRGFNRLAWFIPYLAAATTIAGLIFAAVRLSQRTPVAVETPTGLDSALEARLDDELRNLD